MESKEQLENIWRELSNRMNGLAKMVSQEAKSELELAEGYRFLTRTMASAFEMLVEKADPLRPEFTRATTEYKKVFGDNPDTFYDRVAVDPGRSYVVKGNRGEVPYLAFCVYGGGTQGMNIVSNMSHADMTFDTNGDFELVLSTERPADAQNWLKVDETSRVFIVRQYFHDPAKPGQASYTIEAVEDIPTPPPLQVGDIAGRIRAVGRYAQFVMDKTTEFSADLEKQPNQLPVDSRAAEGVMNFFPTSDNDYYVGWYKVADDEALVIEGAPPECIYWSLTLYNRWFESYDYRFREVYRNNSQITLQDDGRYALVISGRDPGVSNWIDTEGHGEGMICFRWLSNTGTVEKPKLTVRKLAELAS